MGNGLSGSGGVVNMNTMSMFGNSGTYITINATTQSLIDTAIADVGWKPGDLPPLQKTIDDAVMAMLVRCLPAHRPSTEIIPPINVINALASMPTTNAALYKRCSDYVSLLRCGNHYYFDENAHEVYYIKTHLDTITMDILRDYFIFRPDSDIAAGAPNLLQEPKNVFNGYWDFLATPTLWKPTSDYVMNMTNGDSFMYPELINPTQRCASNTLYREQPICPKYCLSSNERAKECGLETRCLNGTGDDAQCQAYCASGRLGYPCDAIRLQTLCADPNNFDNPLCRDYCSRRPVECMRAKTTFCQNNIMNPACADIARTTYNITDPSGVNTSYTARAELDAAAFNICAETRAMLQQRQLVYPIDYATISEDPDLKARVDFCSCILSPIGDFGQPGCADTRCQISGWKTQNMMDVECASCMQIINAAGSFINISGNTQTMTCDGGSGAVKYANVPEDMKLASKYVTLWRRLTTATGGKSQYIPDMPDIATAFNTLAGDVAMLPNIDNGLSELQMVKFANALGAVHVGPTWQFVPFDAAELMNITTWMQNVGAAQYNTLVNKILTYIKTPPDYSIMSTDGANAMQQIVGTTTPLMAPIANAANPTLDNMFLYNTYVPVWTVNGVYTPPSNGTRLDNFVKHASATMPSEVSLFTPEPVHSANMAKLAMIINAFVLTTADKNGVLLPTPPVTVIVDRINSNLARYQYRRFACALFNMSYTNADILPNGQQIVKDYIAQLKDIMQLSKSGLMLMQKCYAPIAEQANLARYKLMALCAASTCKDKYVVTDDMITNYIDDPAWNVSTSKTIYIDMFNTYLFLRTVSNNLGTIRDVDMRLDPSNCINRDTAAPLANKTNNIQLQTLLNYALSTPQSTLIDIEFRSDWVNSYLTFVHSIRNPKFIHMAKTFLVPVSEYKRYSESAYYEYARSLETSDHFYIEYFNTDGKSWLDVCAVAILANLKAVTINNPLPYIVDLFLTVQKWRNKDGKLIFPDTSPAAFYKLFSDGFTPLFVRYFPKIGDSAYSVIMSTDPSTLALPDIGPFITQVKDYLNTQQTGPASVVTTPSAPIANVTPVSSTPSITPVADVTPKPTPVVDVTPRPITTSPPVTPTSTQPTVVYTPPPVAAVTPNVPINAGSNTTPVSDTTPVVISTSVTNTSPIITVSTPDAPIATTTPMPLKETDDVKIPAPAASSTKNTDYNMYIIYAIIFAICIIITIVIAKKLTRPNSDTLMNNNVGINTSV